MKLPPEPLIDLLHGAPQATLATHSLVLPDYPYATAVTVVPDHQHQPLLLLSGLAEHTRNLLADPRVGLSLLEPGAQEAQAAARLSLLGDAEALVPGAPLLARYLRYQPAAEAWLGLDFMFFRIVPRRLRYIAGFGQMGWVEAAAWGELASLDPAAEPRLLALAENGLAPGVRVLGIDRYGIDYQSAGQRRRQRFAAAPLDDDELRRQLALFAQATQH